jgi:hypothetical protein
MRVTNRSEQDALRSPDRSRKIRLGRRVVVPALAVWLLAGCTTGGQVPQGSARPAYSAPQRAPYYVAPQQATPAPYYVEPPRRRYVAPVPDEPTPDQAALMPADPCVGWWRICHFL